MIRIDRPTPHPILPGQESVWDYPRPPAVRPSAEHVRVVHAGRVIADTHRAVCVLETAHAPGYYIPRDDIDLSLLRASRRTTYCEFKGRASYVHLELPAPGPSVVADVGWTYEWPSPGYEGLTGAISFYPQRVDLCEVDGEAVIPLPDDFYGDWPTSRIAGPYKGGPGTRGW